MKKVLAILFAALGVTAFAGNRASDHPCGGFDKSPLRSVPIQYNSQPKFINKSSNKNIYSNENGNSTNFQSVNNTVVLNTPSSSHDTTIKYTYIPLPEDSISIKPNENYGYSVSLLNKDDQGVYILKTVNGKEITNKPFIGSYKSEKIPSGYHIVEVHAYNKVIKRKVYVE